VAKRPVAPKDCITENAEPAAMSPITACAPEATDEAAIPAYVKPILSIAPPNKVAKPPVAPAVSATVIGILFLSKCYFCIEFLLLLII
jgi:hypothetical protein